ncbi:hypothetical protein SAMN02745781_00076 [Vibrio gazogenes DSM 21264]|uniref:Uncharacterized protein n=1 Tax=Vibrio gazogenes DSM 21264 = NBRC 103151 TaxID=1123492 RepID=A0A1M4SIC2_VIBGA|nr:hypothetical protein SAMN02745781_00076 [Vibrio gazogenes DSM 21264] [Vibrio gazogenes DSM 21264 = NBRC 103151]SJN57555.1 hypothetical protein BQ6471_02592 [Vibrio gazogenes]
MSNQAQTISISHTICIVVTSIRRVKSHRLLERIVCMDLRVGSRRTDAWNNEK